MFDDDADSTHFQSLTDPIRHLQEYDGADPVPLGAELLCVRGGDPATNCHLRPCMCYRRRCRLQQQQQRGAHHRWGSGGWRVPVPALAAALLLLQSAQRQDQD